jgi:hypothetical protein
VPKTKKKLVTETMRVIQRNRDLLGGDVSTDAAQSSELVATHAMNGDVDRAIKSQEQLLVDQIQHHGVDSFDALRAEHTLGMMLHDVGDLERARESQQSVLALTRLRFPDQDVLPHQYTPRAGRIRTLGAARRRAFDPLRGGKWTGRRDYLEGPQESGENQRGNRG